MADRQWRRGSEVEAVAVRGLRKHYGELCAVDGVSFTVARGEVFGLVGPKGAGKSTTMGILAGRRTRCSGEVAVLGVDPALGGRAFRERIGVVPQEPAFETRRTPRQLLGVRIGASARARRVDELTALVGLEAKRDARIETLTVGERRRIALAIALIGDPEVILLDEPTTAFDPVARAELGALLADLSAMGTTVVLTTNRVGEARRIADRVGVMAAGRLVAVGVPAELARLGGCSRGVIRFRLPEHIAGCDLPDAGHRLSIGLDRIVELRSASVTHDLGWLTQWASDRAILLEDLTFAPPSFEDAYLELVGLA